MNETQESLATFVFCALGSLISSLPPDIFSGLRALGRTYVGRRPAAAAFLGWLPCSSSAGRLVTTSTRSSAVGAKRETTNPSN